MVLPTVLPFAVHLVVAGKDKIAVRFGWGEVEAT